MYQCNGRALLPVQMLYREIIPVQIWCTGTYPRREAIWALGYYPRTDVVHGRLSPCSAESYTGELPLLSRSEHKYEKILVQVCEVLIGLTAVSRGHGTG
jgi:hypothetical protein